jgi:ATP-binding cassette subfamily G (WHITE) protein 2 (PDR)
LRSSTRPSVVRGFPADPRSEPNTNSFYSRGGLIFFAILLNAFGSALEILTLYAQRGIVEKHAQYAL